MQRDLYGPRKRLYKSRLLEFPLNSLLHPGKAQLPTAVVPPGKPHLAFYRPVKPPHLLGTNEPWGT